MAAFWKKFSWGKKKGCDQSKCDQGQCPKPDVDQDQTNLAPEQNETKTTSTDEIN